MKQKEVLKIISDPALYSEKEANYLRVRALEGWDYPLDRIKKLPEFPSRHPHAPIWAWRRRSLARFARYLERRFRGQSFRLLDVGCGNGWMTHYLAHRFEQSECCGVDLNLAELKLAATAFQRPNLNFIFANLEKEVLAEENKFDIILFAGSFQYFEQADRILSAAKNHLATGGEIHIIDSNFYKNPEARAHAQAATQAYYSRLGLPEMAVFYHHHLQQSITGENLNNSLVIRILQKIKYLSPFPWIRTGV